MAAAGKVCIGFTSPYVAVYNNAGGSVTYSKGQELARGVSVELEVNAADENKFYANNMVAETAPARFGGGKVTLTVDGLLNEARALIRGLPAPSKVQIQSNPVDVYEYGEGQTPPYMGLCWIAVYQSEGAITYAPTMLTKIRFDEIGDSAKTMEEDVDWQTEELTAQISRDDSEKHVWKRLAADQTTEAAALAVIKQWLSIV